METIYLSVDGQEPITFEEFKRINTAKDVEPLLPEQFEAIKNLKVGETWTTGGAGNCEVERVYDTFYTRFKVRPDIVEQGHGVPAGGKHIYSGVYEGRWLGDDFFQLRVNGEWLRAQSIDFDSTTEELSEQNTVMG